MWTSCRVWRSSFCNHQNEDWIRLESLVGIKSRGTFWWGAGYLHAFELLLHKLLISCKRENTQLLYSRKIGQNLDQVVKVKITIGGQIEIMCMPPDVMSWGRMTDHLCTTWLIIYNLGLIIRKCHTSLKWGMFN